MIFSYFEFATAAPGIDEGGHRLRGGGDLFLHERQLHLGVFMLQEQLGDIDLGAILIAFVFFDEFRDLKARAADHISNFQELRRFALIE